MARKFPFSVVISPGSDKSRRRVAICRGNVASFTDSSTCRVCKWMVFRSDTLLSALSTDIQIKTVSVSSTPELSIYRTRVRRSHIQRHTGAYADPTADEDANAAATAAAAHIFGYAPLSLSHRRQDATTG